MGKNKGSMSLSPSVGMETWSVHGGRVWGWRLHEGRNAWKESVGMEGAWTTKQRFGDNVITIMIKLWSDDTNLGGNDRLPVKVFRIRIGNHPLSFSKTDAGQAIIGLMTNTLRAPSELQDNNQCLIVFSV